MRRLFLATTMFTMLATTPLILSAQDGERREEVRENRAAARVYYDRVHHDRHEWNDGEGAAWNRYRDEHHVAVVEFNRAPRREQQNYWNWRHEHPDNH